MRDGPQCDSHRHIGLALSVLVLGRPAAIGRTRGKVIALADGAAVVTIHPSWLLRIREDADRTREFEAFVKDLILARKAAAQA